MPSMKSQAACQGGRTPRHKCDARLHPDAGTGQAEGALQAGHRGISALGDSHLCLGFTANSNGPRPLPRARLSPLSFPVVFGNAKPRDPISDWVLYHFTRQFPQGRELCAPTERCLVARNAFSRWLISPCTEKKMPWHDVIQYLQLFRGGAIGSTPAFGAGYPGSSPGPGAILPPILQSCFNGRGG